MDGEEIWRPAIGYEGLYKVSNIGRVKSLTRSVLARAGKFRVLKERILKLTPRPDGYLCVSLSAHNAVEHKLVHRLVLEIFVGPCPEGEECRHLNDDKTDNRLDNLIWSTHPENMDDRSANGSFKITPEQIKQLREVSSYGSVKKLAGELGIHAGHASRIRTGKRWSHVS